jgi:uncharacterized membrane protein AbrB (regulator of aidB expression)
LNLSGVSAAGLTGEMAAMSDGLQVDFRLAVIMQYTRLLLILALLALVTPSLSHDCLTSSARKSY